MHEECAHYALRVCPYLATPNYSKPIAGRTVPSDDPVVLAANYNVGDFQPDVFVAVLARGQDARSEPMTDYIRPKRPFMRMEFWRHGRILSLDEGTRIAGAIMAKHKLEGV
jgi:hypothetical protein